MEIGITCAAGAFDHPIPGPHLIAAPGAAAANDGGADLYLMHGGVPKGFADRFDTLEELGGDQRHAVPLPRVAVWHGGGIGQGAGPLIGTADAVAFGNRIIPARFTDAALSKVPRPAVEVVLRVIMIDLPTARAAAHPVGFTKLVTTFGAGTGVPR